MVASREKSGLARQLLEELEWVELHLASRANLVGSDETDAGTMEWWGSATVRAFPLDDEGSAVGPWYKAEGTALSKTTHEDSVDITIFEANGLIIDLQHVEDIYDALDARSADYSTFIPLFGRRDQFGFVTLNDDLEDKIESLGSHAVIIDRVRLAPAWRGLGGVGRLLASRLLRWICAEPRIVAVLPFPIDLDQDSRQDASLLQPALDQVCRTWKSLGFRRATNRLWIMDPANGKHEKAVSKLEKSLGL